MRKYVCHLLFRQCTLQTVLSSTSVALGSVHIADHWALLIKHCCNAEEGYEAVLHLLCVKWLATCQSKNIRQTRARRNRLIEVSQEDNGVQESRRVAAAA